LSISPSSAAAGNRQIGCAVDASRLNVVWWPADIVLASKGRVRNPGRRLDHAVALCAIAGGHGQSMPKLTCAPRKLAWAPMARKVVWLVPSCLQRLSTRMRGPVKLVAGKLIYTAWDSNSLSAQGIFGDFWRRETVLAQHTREQSATAVVKGIVR
jgi:hypothetical protein